jgi:hypothetical protein
MLSSALNRPDPTSAARLTRLSRTMEWVTVVGMALIVVGTSAAAIVPAWSRNLLLARLGETGARLPLEPSHQAIAALIFAVPVGVMIWGLWHVRALFRDFSHGRVFTGTAARHLQLFGISVLVQGLLGPLVAAALGVALSLGNPPGQRFLVLTLSSNDYFAVIVGGVLVAVAAVMREAARIADENASFV